MASLLYASTSFASYDLYCGSHPAAKDFECLPANVGDWVYYGGSYPYGLQYNQRASLDEIFEEFTSDIKSKYAVCSANLSVDSILNDRFDFNSILVRSQLVLTTPACNENIDSLNTFNAYRFRSVTCDEPSQGPFYSPDGLPYCAFPLVYEDTSCPTDTPTLPGTGVKLLQEDDVAGAGVHPLAFTRHYRSRWPNGISSAALPMGAGWTHTYDRSIVVVQGAPTPMLRALRGDGSWRTFVRDDSSSTTTSITWRDISPRATLDRLTQKLTSNGQTSSWIYRAHSDDSVETYDADGRLKRINARNGWVTTLVYSSASTPPTRAPQAGLLLAVHNHFGRELRLSYDSAGRVTKLTTPAGEVIRYDHDTLGNLTAITRPNPGTNASTTQHYHYEDSRSLNAHALTGLTDALGVRITTYTYDALGQVATTEKAQGLEKLSFQLSSPVGANSVIFYTPTPGAASTVTQYSFSSIAGVLRPTSVSTPCPLCGASAAATSYDANQRKSKVIAHDGRVTFYTYNAKGRVTREATYPASYQSATTLPPLSAAEHVTHTQWHATWNLPLKVAEAYLITSYSYDGKGNLLELIETPTTDAIGAKGFNATPSDTTYTTRWTYDAKNLPTTIVELEGSTETGRWDMAYNATGDLTGITHVTTGTVATLAALGDGASQVTSITQGASPAVNPAMATVTSLGVVRPANVVIGIALPVGVIIVAGAIINSNNNSTGLAPPTPFPIPRRNIWWPDKTTGMWSCKARADCNDNQPNNCPEDPAKRFAFGGGEASDLGTARNIAKANATSNLQCQPKHVSCRCTDPKGSHAYEGGC